MRDWFPTVSHHDSMRSDTAATVHRLEYTPPAFWVDSIDIGFDLDPKATRVAARSKMRRNPDSQQQELVLHGEELDLVAIRMNGKTLTKRRDPSRFDKLGLSASD